MFPPPKKKTIYVTGGADQRSFSGCSYYFSESLRKYAGQSDVIALRTNLYKIMRLNLAIWSARHLVDPRPYFYLTEEYQEFNYQSNKVSISKGDTYISFSPVLPQSIAASDCNVIHMIDMTLHQYLRYEHFGRVPRRVEGLIKRSEKASYDRANRIFVPTVVTRRQLIDLYGVSEDKIDVIGRGVNLPSVLPPPSSVEHRNGDRLHICFIGHDFKRKGLLTLLDAIDSLPELRDQVVVHAIGPTEKDLGRKPWLRTYGYVSKAENLRYYIDIIKRCDVGYLFSQSEGIPGSVLEFIHLQLPCIISDIPEMESIRNLPGIIVVKLADGIEGIAELIRNLVGSPSDLLAIRGAASQTATRGWDDQAREVTRWC